MSKRLWDRGEAVLATQGVATGAWDSISGIAIDTREMARGDLFVALAGENRDGHDFVAQALTAGAGAALVTHRPDGVAEDAPLLVVADTLKALEALGRAARRRTGAKVVAVTGSVGKTSTKEMLRSMFVGQGRVHAAARSFNNHWGVPLTLARMPADTDFAVLEIGMNHPGEITPLTQLARPHAAMITNVEAVHMAAFDSVDQIADAKAEIFTGLEPGGTAILNADNPYFGHLRSKASAAQPDCQIVSFGAQGDIRLVSARISGAVTLVRAEMGGAPLAFKLGVPGLHFAGNALGALGAVHAVGADVARAMIALANWTPPEGRGSRVTLALGPGGLDGTITLLDESYNANPASMRAALGVLGASEPTDGVGRVNRGRRLAYLGDMLELGPTETALHAGLAALPEMDAIDRVHCCGPRMKALHEALPVDKRGFWLEDSEKLAEILPKTIDAGDVCMVKGSLGARMARVVSAIKRLGQETPTDPDEDT